MEKCKLILTLNDGTRVWLNMFQMVKMVKLSNDKYVLYMSNGDIFELSYKEAKIVEGLLES